MSVNNNDDVLYGMIWHSHNLLKYDQNLHQEVNTITDHLVDSKIKDDPNLPNQITYQSKNGDIKITTLDHIKAIDNPYELSNLYADLNQSIETNPYNLPVVKALYHPMNIKVNFLSADYRNQYLLKHTIAKYEMLLDNNNDDTLLSAHAHPLFNQLYTYQNNNAGFNYRHIKDLGSDFELPFNHSVPNHYHYILHLQPELPQPLAVKKSNTQVINNEDILCLPLNFATKKDYEALDIDNIYKLINAIKD